MAQGTNTGALSRQNGEGVAGIALAERVVPGVRVVYGSGTANVDMRSGAPAFGTPEYVKATIISGQLARRYGLPLRASNANASNAPDVQSAYESQMSLWACIVGGINYVLHGLGWIEGGLCASYEKVIIDAEMIQMIRAMLQPTVIDDASLAVDAIAEVGPANHFFGAAHTLERYDSAFYEPMLSDWRNFETWYEDGALDATQRANRIWKQLLADYEEPPMDDAIRAVTGHFGWRGTPIVWRVGYWTEADLLSDYGDSHRHCIRAIWDLLPPGLSLIGSDYCFEASTIRGLARLDGRIGAGRSAARAALDYLRAASR